MNAIAKRPVVALGMGFVAALIFAIGLIGPLTPSYGQPSLTAWLVFSILPLLLTTVAFVAAKQWLVKIVLLAEGSLILLITVGLLRLHKVF